MGPDFKKLKTSLERFEHGWGSDDIKEILIIVLGITMAGICFKIWGQKKEWKVVETRLAKWQDVKLRLGDAYTGIIMLFSPLLCIFKIVYNKRLKIIFLKTALYI